MVEAVAHAHTHGSCRSQQLRSVQGEEKWRMRKWKRTMMESVAIEALESGTVSRDRTAEARGMAEV